MNIALNGYSQMSRRLWIVSVTIKFACCPFDIASV